jgi:4-amino-4-deoxy-L-arabinose transferase-like glycosyltransferase
MTAIPAQERSTASGAPWLQAMDKKAAAALRALAFRPYAGAIALVLLCCALYLPGIATLPVTDRDEARFAQATKQMLETGDYVDIRFQAEPRYKKPIGIYWLQSAAVTAARQAGAKLDDIWAYRIPSFLGALAAVLLTFWTARAVLGRQDALAAAALFACCLTLSFESRIAKSDAALIASIMVAQGALFRLYLARRGAKTRGLAALFWIGLGASILIKGPVGPGLAILTLAAVLLRDRRRAWLKGLHWGWGVPLVLAITLPWFIAIGISSHGEFFRASLGQDFGGKLQGGQEKHWGPPGFYFIAFWWTFWPSVLFVTGGAVRALWQGRRSRRALFLLAWIVPFWLAIEAIPTKLPHYALPLYPAVAMAAVYALRRAPEDERRWRWSPALWLAFAFLQIAVLIGVLWLAEAPQLPIAAALLLILGAAAIYTAVSAWGQFANGALAGAVACAAVFSVATFSVTLPAIEPLWMSEEAAAAVRALRPCGTAPSGFAGYAPPSLVFLNGTNTLLAPPRELGDALSNGVVDLAFVNWKDRQTFESEFLEKAGAAPLFLGCVDGIDINGKGPTRLHVYARAGAAGPGCRPVMETVCRDRDAVRWRRMFGTKF